MHGKILNRNTIEQFKDCDKNMLICGEGLMLWDSVKDGSVLEDPSLLNSFIILSFAVGLNAFATLRIVHILFVVGPQEISLLLLVCFSRCCQSYCSKKLHCSNYRTTK